MIIRNERALGFPVGHGTLGMTQIGSWIKVKIANGGEKVGWPTRLRGRSFRKFSGVQFDKTATTHSSEDWKAYQQLNDHFYTKFSRETE